MPKKKRPPTKAELLEAERTLRRLLRCRIIYPAQYGVFCKKTPKGPFYLAQKSRKYPGLSDEIPQIKASGGYRGCFITVLQDSCLPRGQDREDWLGVKKWKKR